MAPRPYSTGSGSVFLNNVQRTKSTPDLSGSGPQEKVRQSLESINDDGKIHVLFMPCWVP